jgi:very-short-patch-repair endonuclease
MNKYNREIIPYNPKLTKFAKELRKNSTPAEIDLWRHLNKKKMMGYDFHRQKPLDNFIVDFFCNDLMLVIEIDGITHDYKTSDDINRQKRLESCGVRFLRFTEKDVKMNLKGVLEIIRQWIIKHTPSSSD